MMRMINITSLSIAKNGRSQYLLHTQQTRVKPRVSPLPEPPEHKAEYHAEIRIGDL